MQMVSNEVWNVANRCNRDIHECIYIYMCLTHGSLNLQKQNISEKNNKRFFLVFFMC